MSRRTTLLIVSLAVLVVAGTATALALLAGDSGQNDEGAEAEEAPGRFSDRLFQELTDRGLLEQDDAHAYRRAVEAVPQEDPWLSPEPEAKQVRVLPGLMDRLLQTAADEMDLDPQALREELRRGAGLAEVARERGVDPGDLRETLETEARALLEEAVADGRIGEDQADGYQRRIGRIVEQVMGRRLPPFCRCPFGPFAPERGLERFHEHLKELPEPPFEWFRREFEGVVPPEEWRKRLDELLNELVPSGFLAPEELERRLGELRERLEDLPEWPFPPDQPSG